MKERSPVGNGCMGGRLGAKKSGAVAIQNWNCSITSYSDHAPHPSSPLAIFGHQSFLDICTRCREKGRAGGEADQLKDEILEVWTKSWKSEESHRILRLLLLKLMATPQMVLRHHLMVKTLADGMEEPRF